MPLRTATRHARWAALALGTVLAGALGPLPAAMPAAAAAGQPAGTAARPQGEIAELNFLLGDFDCAYVDHTLPEPTTVTVRWSTEKSPSGRIYSMSLSGTTPPFEGTWLFGRNPQTEGLASFYRDTWGNIGTPTSPGWNDDVLTFQGTYRTSGGNVLSKDEFQVVDEDRFLDNAYVRLTENEEWRQISHVDCRRV